MLHDTFSPQDAVYLDGSVVFDFPKGYVKRWLSVLFEKKQERFRFHRTGRELARALAKQYYLTLVTDNEFDAEIMRCKDDALYPFGFRVLCVDSFTRLQDEAGGDKAVAVFSNLFINRFPLGSATVRRYATAEELVEMVGSEMVWSFST